MWKTKRVLFHFYNRPPVISSYLLLDTLFNQFVILLTNCTDFSSFAILSAVAFLVKRSAVSSALIIYGSGFVCLPFILTSKCKCGPVEFPVLPTYPITCPAFTSSPTDTICSF